MSLSVYIRTASELLVEFNWCHICDINIVLRLIHFVKILKIYPSLYMDGSEFIDDDVNDGRISDASHLHVI